jgi:hypothetical protein
VSIYPIKIFFSVTEQSSGSSPEIQYFDRIMVFQRAAPQPSVSTSHGNSKLPKLTSAGESHERRKCNTLEEKIQEAMRQIEELRIILYRKERELLSRIYETDINIRQLINNVQADVDKLNGLLSNINCRWNKTSNFRRTPCNIRCYIPINIRMLN